MQSNQLPDDKLELETLKLKAEITQLRRPWFKSTFGWGTLISVVSLVALAFSGLIDIQAERNANQALLTEIKRHEQERLMRENEVRVAEVNKQLQISTDALAAIKAELKVAGALGDAFSEIAAMGGRVEAWQEQGEVLYKVEVPTMRGDDRIFSSTEADRPIFFDNKFIQHLRAIPNIVELEVNFHRISNAELTQVFESCTNLRALRVWGAEDSTGAILDGLDGCHNLQYLSVRHVAFSQQHLKSLANLSSLSSLSLRECDGISAASLPLLGSLPRLLELDVSQNGISEEQGRRFLSESDTLLMLGVDLNEWGYPAPIQLDIPRQR